MQTNLLGKRFQASLLITWSWRIISSTESTDRLRVVKRRDCNSFRSKLESFHLISITNSMIIGPIYFDDEVCLLSKVWLSFRFLKPELDQSTLIDQSNGSDGERWNASSDAKLIRYVGKNRFVYPRADRSDDANSDVDGCMLLGREGVEWGETTLLINQLEVDHLDTVR